MKKLTLFVGLGVIGFCSGMQEEVKADSHQPQKFQEIQALLQATTTTMTEIEKFNKLLQNDSLRDFLYALEDHVIKEEGVTNAQAKEIRYINILTYDEMKSVVDECIKKWANDEITITKQRIAENITSLKKNSFNDYFGQFSKIKELKSIINMLMIWIQTEASDYEATQKCNHDYVNNYSALIKNIQGNIFHAGITRDSIKDLRTRLATWAQKRKGKTCTSIMCIVLSQ